VTRYFEQFFNGDPMVEIDEARARQRGSYAEEIDASVRLFRCVSAGKLDRLVYAGWTDPAEPLADARRRNEGARIEVYSPVEGTAEGGQRWRVWHADAAGNVHKILEPEFGADGRYLRESYRGPDGELRTYREYVYDRYDELLEVVTHAPDGTVLNREHN